MSEPPPVEPLLRMARALAAERLPWFAPALFAARLVVTDACPSLAAVDDGMRIYFAPRWVGYLRQREEPERCLVQLAWVWGHEISHVLRDHGERARELQAQPLRWNIAADLEINDCRWPDLEPPRALPPVLPDQFRLPAGELAEFYYGRLPPRLGCDAAVAVAGADSPAADEGSGVHGQARPWEAVARETGVSAVSTLEKATLRHEVARALETARQRGTLPGGWRRWAAQILRPQVNWRVLLRRRARRALVLGSGGRLDYSFQRPHRRAPLYAPLIRPSLTGNFAPRIACVVDTSGSISPRDLSQSLAEVRGVLESLRAPVTVIPCDAVAYEPVQVLTQSELIRLGQQLRGGGGTDMRTGIDAALQLRPAPDAVLVLTDGFTPYPARPYRTPVVFGILKSGSRLPVFARPPIPPWNSQDVIEIDRTE